MRNPFFSALFIVIAIVTITLLYRSEPSLITTQFSPTPTAPGSPLHPSFLTAQVGGGTSQTVPLLVKETKGVPRVMEPVLGGVPIPRGQSLSQLRILDSSGSPRPSQFHLISTWNDGSPKWVGYRFLEQNLAANGQSSYLLSWGGGSNAQPQNPLNTQNLSDRIVISTGAYEFAIDKMSGVFPRYAKVDGQSILPDTSSVRNLSITGSDGTLYTSQNTPASVTIDEQGPLTTHITVRGAMKSSAGVAFVNYIWRARFWADTGRMDVSLLYENPGRPHDISPGGDHKFFRSSEWVTDFSFSGAGPLQLDLGGVFSESNYTNQTFTMIQDMTATKHDIGGPVTSTMVNTTDSSEANLLDNFRLRIRDGANALVWNQGGTGGGNPSGNTSVQGISGSRADGGLFRLSNATNAFMVATQHFWQRGPYVYDVTGGNRFTFQFFPSQTSQNDLIHAHGPLLFYDQGNPSIYNQNSGLIGSLVDPRSEQNYVLFDSKAMLAGRFSLRFESQLGVSAQSAAVAKDAPLLALPPGWYYGTQAPSGYTASGVMGPLYSEARNWSGTALSSANAQVANVMEQWFRSLIYPSATCSGATCITLTERRNRGSTYGPDHGAGQNSFLKDGYGEFWWSGDNSGWKDPDANAYELNYGIALAAMRNQDPAYLYELPTDYWTLHALWRPQNTSDTSLVYGWRRYQKGHPEYGEGGGSPRHSATVGDIYYALLLDDPDYKDALRIASWWPAYGYPQVSLNTAASTLQSEVQSGSGAYTPIYSDGPAHMGKSIRQLVSMYDLTGDTGYVTLATKYLEELKRRTDACKNRFGIPFAVETSFSGSGTCTLPNNDTYGGNQAFFMGYMLDGIREGLRVIEQVNGQPHSVLTPWAVEVATFVYQYMVDPYITSGSPTSLYLPNSFFVYKGTSAQATLSAPSACSTMGQNVPRPNGILPLSGSSVPAVFIVCDPPGNYSDTYFYLLPGLSWLYTQTGNSALLDDLMALSYYLYLHYPSPNSTPSWIVSGYGSADIKKAAPAIYAGMPLFAAAVSGVPPQNPPPPPPPPPPQPPSAPSGLTYSLGSGTSVILTWTDTSSNETSFSLERATGLNGTFQQIISLGANTITHTDQTAVAATTYQYRVRALGSAGYSSYSNIIILTTPPSLSGGVTPQPTPFTFSLSSNTSSLAIPSSASQSFTLTALLVSGNGQAVAFTATGLPSGVSHSFSPSSCVSTCTSLLTLTPSSGISSGPHTFTVTASGGDDSQSVSLSFTVTTQSSSPPPSPGFTPPPVTPGATPGFVLPGTSPPQGTFVPPGTGGGIEAPTHLRAARVSPTVIRLTWSDNSSAESIFTISRSEQGASSGFVDVGTVSANRTRFDDTYSFFHRTKTFWYQVRASNLLEGYSSPSNIIEMRPAQEGVVPFAPTDFQATVLSSTYPSPIRFVWNEASVGETRIEIHLSTDGGNFRKVNEFPADTTLFTYHGAGLIPNTQYYYRLVACKDATCSPSSNTATVLIPSGTTPPPPASPPSFVAPGGQGFVFSRNLKLGDTHADVRVLQRCLNRLSYTIASSGVGSSGNESTYFGTRTRDALIRFQNAYRAQVLTPVGLSTGTGFFGAATRAHMNTLGCTP